MTQQLDMDLDGSRRDLHTLVVTLTTTLQMMESRMASILEALGRCGITLRRIDAGWQWSVSNGQFQIGTTDTLPDALEAAIKAQQRKPVVNNVQDVEDALFAAHSFLDEHKTALSPIETGRVYAVAQTFKELCAAVHWVAREFHHNIEVFEQEQT